MYRCYDLIAEHSRPSTSTTICTCIWTVTVVLISGMLMQLVAKEGIVILGSVQVHM